MLGLLLGIMAGVMTIGCTSQPPSPRTQSTPLVAPNAYQPIWASQATGLDPEHRPDPIDLSDPTKFVTTTVEPTIFDTRTAQTQRQITAPFTGEIRIIMHELPEPEDEEAKKSRKHLPADRVDQPIAIGQATDMHRVHHRGAGTGFAGIPQTEWSPPDPTLAVGPNHIVETVNAAIAFYDKDTGNQLFSTHLGTPGNPGFFEPVGANSNFVFDPKCFYDHKAGRFVVVALEQNGNDSWIDIAVSDDDNPMGIWYKYRTFSVITIDSSEYWVDYPGFGFDDQAWYVTGNLFQLSGPGPGFGGQLFRIFNKAPMLSGQPVTMTDFAPSNGSSLQVAQMFGPAPSCYFLSRVSSAGLRLWTITNPLTDPQLDFTTISTFAPASGPSQDAPNPGGGLISTLDGRLMNVHYRDGKLYTAHGINGDPGVTVARWYQIDVNGWPASGLMPQIAQVGEVTGHATDEPDRHYYFPAIYSDRFNNVAMVTASSSPSQYASVRVSGRNSDDPAGTMSTPIELAIGDRSADGRWGDYLDIAMDPDDDTTFWVIGMYRKSFGWQTWIDRITIDAGCPADLTGDGVLNFFDISSFLADYNSQLPSADINGDGIYNFFDVSAYIQLYNQGCP